MTVRLAPFVVHTAAAPFSWKQTCIGCGQVLIDNTAWAEGRVAVLDDDAGGPAWYPVSARVATDRTNDRTASMTYMLGPEGRPLAADERLCAGVN